MLLVEIMIKCIFRRLRGACAVHAAHAQEGRLAGYLDILVVRVVRGIFKKLQLGQ